MSHGLDETILSVAILSLGLNLVLTGVFIAGAKHLLDSARRDKAALAPA